MSIKVVNARLTSSAGGTAVATINTNGALAGIEIANHATLTATANWDLVVKTQKGTTVFSSLVLPGTGSILTAQAFTTYFKPPIAGGVTLNAANMGATRVADILIYTED